MKKIAVLFLVIICTQSVVSQTITAQTTTLTFEDYTLANNSFYKDTNNVPFQTSTAEFQHEWITGAFPYWSAGFSYTNIYDSTTVGFTNLYGVIAHKGVNNSAMFVVGQNHGIVRTKNKYTIVNGFYYTNTTYAYKSMKNGDQFARKFGDTTGTGSGTIIAQGEYPDYFKLVLFGYKNGTKKTDSVEIFLADFRFTTSAQDFIVDNWRYANTSALGSVDSIEYVLRSSDNGAFGMNTPAFFAIDNFETSIENPVAIADAGIINLYKVFPVPFNSVLTIEAPADFSVEITDIAGHVVANQVGHESMQLNLTAIAAGYYSLRITDSFGTHTKTLIKE